MARIAGLLISLIGIVHAATVTPSVIPVGATINLVFSGHSGSLNGVSVRFANQSSCTDRLGNQDFVVSGDTLQYNAQLLSVFGAAGDKKICKLSSGFWTPLVDHVRLAATSFLLTPQVVLGDTASIALEGQAHSWQESEVYLSTLADACRSPRSPSTALKLCDNIVAFWNSFGCNLITAFSGWGRGKFRVCLDDGTSRGPAAIEANSTLEVLKYTATPAHAFMGVDPRVQVADDAPCTSTTKIKVVSGTSCDDVTNPVHTYLSCSNSVMQPAWTPGATGEFSYCMVPRVPDADFRDPSWPHVRAGGVRVWPKPDVTFAVYPIRHAVPNRMVASTSAPDVGVSLSKATDCSDIVIAWPKGNHNANFRPFEAHPSPMTVCIRAADDSLHPLQPAETEPFKTRYEPLFAGKQTPFGFDPLTPSGDRFLVVPKLGANDACPTPATSWASVPSAQASNWPTATIPVGDSGRYDLCLGVNGTHAAPVRELRVFDPADVKEKMLVRGLGNTLTVTNMFGQAPVSVAANCGTSSKVASTAVAGQTDPEWKWLFGVPPATPLGNVKVCVEYPASPNKEIAVGTLNVRDLTHDRKYFVTNAVSRLQFALPQASEAYLTQTASCDVATPTDQLTVDSAGSTIVDGSKYAVANYSVCLKATPFTLGARTFVRSGWVQVIAPYALGFKESWAPVAVLPVHPAVSHPAQTIDTAQQRLALKRPVTRRAGAGDVTPCDTVSSGDSVAATDAMNLKKGKNVVCVEAPDNNGFFLFAGEPDAPEVMAVTRSFFIDSTADVTTSIGLEPKANYSFAKDCASGTRHPVTHLTRLGVIPTATDYRICTQILPDKNVAQSGNTVTVFPKVTANLPARIRRNVPYNIDFTSNPRQPPVVYTKEGVTQCVYSTDKASVAGRLDTGASAMKVLARGLPRRDIRYTLCAVSPDETAAAEVDNMQAVPYLSPWLLPFNHKVRVFAGQATGSPREARVAYQADCKDVDIVGVNSVINVDAQGYTHIDVPREQDLRNGQKEGFFCEKENGVWTFKGDALFVPSFEVRAPMPLKPGIVHDLMIFPPSADRQSYYSRSPVCVDREALTQEAVFPFWNDEGVFFVCVKHAELDEWYTVIPEAKVQVSRFKLNPDDIFERIPTKARLEPRLAEIVSPSNQGIRISKQSSCGNALGAVNVDTNDLLLDTSMIGPAFVCLELPAGGMRAVENITVWETPVVNIQHPVIHGAPMCFAAAVSGSQYSLYGNSPRYTAHLVAAGDSCDDVTKQHGSTPLLKPQTCVSTFDTPYNATLTLCIQAPPRFVPVTSIKPIAMTMWPGKLTDTRPPYERFLVEPGHIQPGDYGFARNVGECTTARRSDFSTDNTGLATTPVANPTIPQGPLVLCMKYPVTNTWEAVVRSEMLRPYHYGLTSTVMLTTQPNPVAALHDLVVPNFRGFSTTPDCNAPLNGTGGVPRMIPGVGLRMVFESVDQKAGDFYACGYVPWNNTMSAFTVIRFVDSVLATDSSYVTCVPQLLSYHVDVIGETVLNNLSSDVYLSNAACCGSPTFDVRDEDFVVRGDLISPVGRHRDANITLPYETFRHFAGDDDVKSFHLCAVNAHHQTCLDAGPVEFRYVATECNRTASGVSTRAHIFGAPRQLSDASLLLALLLGLLFLCCLLLLLLICCLCCWLRRKKQIPQEDRGLDMGGWDTLEEKDQKVRVQGEVEMDLGPMHDPVIVVDVLRAEEIEREQIENAAEFTAERLWADFDNRGRELAAAIEADDRAGVEGRANTVQLRERLQLEDVEAEARDILAALQDEERLRMMELEHDEWRHASRADEKELMDAIERSERAKSRKKRLLESSSAMMKFVGDAAQLRSVSPREDFTSPANDGVLDPYDAAQRRQSFFNAATGEPQPAAPLAPQMTATERAASERGASVHSRTQEPGPAFPPGANPLRGPSAGGQPPVRQSQWEEHHEL